MYLFLWGLCLTGAVTVEKSLLPLEGSAPIIHMLFTRDSNQAI